MGVCFSYLVAARPLSTLPPDGYALAHGTVLDRYAEGTGYGEAMALATAVVLTLLQRGQPRTATLIGLAAIATLAMILIWAWCLQPLDRVIASWTAGAVPADWETTRDRWQLFNAVRMVLAIIAFLAVSWSLFPRPRWLRPFVERRPTS
jgi:hypothetical protein